MIDFSKAFDTVDHVILIRKLQALNIPPNFYSLQFLQLQFLHPC